VFVSATRANISKMLNDGASLDQIALALGLARNTIEYHVTRLHVETRARPPAQIPDLRDTVRQVGTRDRVAALLAEGLGRLEIARKLGLSKSTVSYNARRLGAGVDAMRPSLRLVGDSAVLRRGTVSPSARPRLAFPARRGTPHADAGTSCRVLTLWPWTSSSEAGAIGNISKKRLSRWGSSPANASAVASPTGAVGRSHSHCITSTVIGMTTASRTSSSSVPIATARPRTSPGAIGGFPQSVEQR
jgi:DNA-binding CsgD family transcriptional regulator